MIIERKLQDFQNKTSRQQYTLRDLERGSLVIGLSVMSIIFSSSLPRRQLNLVSCYAEDVIHFTIDITCGSVDIYSQNGVVKLPSGV